MNSTFNDITHCQICFNPFGSKESCPRIVSCGHTFCHSCLQRFISEGSVCPTCKKDIHFHSADDILINFCVKSFSETARKTMDSPKAMKDNIEAASLTDSEEFLVVKKSKTNELPYEGHCEEHFAPNHFKCMNCIQYICGTCAQLTHKSCLRVLPVLEALNLMKGESLKKMKVFKTKLDKEAKMLDSKLTHLNRKQEKLYQEIESVESEIKETKCNKERNQKLQEDSSCHKENLEKAACNEDYEKVDVKLKFFFKENCVDNLLPLSVLSKEDALTLTREDLEENTFYVMKRDNENKKYSKVKIEDDQISFEEWEEEAEGGSSCVDFLDFINSRISVIDTHQFIDEHMKELHNPKLPKDKIKFSQIEVKEREVYFHSFKTSGGSDFVFKFGSILKTLGCSSGIPKEAFLNPQNSSGGNIVITTDEESSRGLYFLLLASGILDDSYQRTQLFSNHSYLDGGHNNECRLISDVVLRSCQQVIKRGDVVGGNHNNLSYFSVCKKDESYQSTSTFGKVKRGMEVVDQMNRYDTVKECGLLLDFPY